MMRATPMSGRTGPAEERGHRPARTPLTSLLTFEPGGQLELSSLPAASLTDCIEAVTADLAQVRPAMLAMGLSLAGHGHNPWHPRGGC